jgi:hypothetical protein
MQEKIQETGNLLDDQGELRGYGWSERPLLRYRRSAVKASWLRIKEWDYYLVLGPEYGVAFTIADIGYLSQASVSVIDLEAKRAVTETPMRLLTRGRTGLPPDSGDGIVRLRQGGASLRFERQGERRTLGVDFPRFDGGRGLSGSVELVQSAGDDSIVLATPFDKPRAFYFNEKLVCMPASGSLRYGDRDLSFAPGTSFGTLDWGRGVWPYRNTWYWGGGAGIVNGRRFGFNIGYGFGANDRATENALFLDGKIHKLEEVVFHIDEGDYLRPWSFSSSDGRFEMSFEPILDRSARASFLAIKTDQHQIFGRYSGIAVLDGGERIELDGLLGFAEKVVNLW